MDYTKGSVVEIVCEGMTYIGKFVEEKDGKVLMTGVLGITSVPMPAPDGKGIMHTPKFDILNFFSNEKTPWEFSADKIIYSSDDIGSTFVEFYENHEKGYRESKVKEGSGIEVVKDIPAGLKTNA
jgi:hypothetical protein